MISFADKGADDHFDPMNGSFTLLVEMTKRFAHSPRVKLTCSPREMRSLPSRSFGTKSRIQTSLPKMFERNDGLSRLLSKVSFVRFPSDNKS